MDNATIEPLENAKLEASGFSFGNGMILGNGKYLVWAAGDRFGELKLSDIIKSSALFKLPSWLEVILACTLVPLTVLTFYARYIASRGAPLVPEWLIVIGPFVVLLVCGLGIWGRQLPAKLWSLWHFVKPSWRRYHAAEHMVICALEKGLPLTLENVRAQPMVHPHCGSGVFPFVIAGSIITQQFLFPWDRLASLAILLIGCLLVGLGFYEPFPRWALIYQRPLLAPPTDAELEVAIKLGKRLRELNVGDCPALADESGAMA